MSELVIETNNLLKQYGKRKVVHNLNMSVKKGGIYGFLGPNGAGKTTTIRMLLGLAKPTGGSIHLFGQEMRKNRLAILKKVGSLVESPSYYEHLNAHENLDIVRKILDVPKTRIDEVLATVRLTKEAKRPVKGFSLGMKQRLGIATALLGNPELLILDEPTNGLDPAGIHEIRELIKSLPQENGTTILVSSHLLTEIDQMATQVGVISKGQMIFQDSIEAIRNKATSKIRLRVANSEQAWRYLQSVGYQAKWEKGDVYIENASDETIATMVETLVHKNFPLYRVEEEKKSLEEIFLEMIGEEGSL
ncbi:ABC transporter ATP-binding protein [Viridibacillus sp. NPDC096237]|uniref:ABC transporter ATP-binding protein n=1 Tax=Viridibacillus sp. NPDC096237 TaxID=3390721 RepID=UPI003CFDF187